MYREVVMRALDEDAEREFRAFEHAQTPALTRAAYSAQGAFVIGWADDTHALVELWFDSGAQRVESVNVRSGTAATVISVGPGTSQTISVAGEIVRAGGFR